MWPSLVGDGIQTNARNIFDVTEGDGNIEVL